MEAVKGRSIKAATVDMELFTLGITVACVRVSPSSSVHWNTWSDIRLAPMGM